MKAFTQRVLQQFLGYSTYLWVFTRFKLLTLRWDKNERDFFYFLSLLDTSDCVLDIGANLGLMSYYLAKKCEVVHAFEPMPNNFKNLERLKQHYKLQNLLLHQTALGESNQQVELVLPVVGGVKKQGLSHVVTEKIKDFNEGNKISATCYKLDDFNAIQEIKISGIKIDVENFEFEVFKGAEALLRRDKPIIYAELWDNQNRHDCFEYLTNLGYHIYVLDRGKLKNIKSNPNNIQNFFFLPADH
jgi:FkbM family methyltransferase